jgi:hypothetical protein
MRHLAPAIVVVSAFSVAVPYAQTSQVAASAGRAAAARVPSVLPGTRATAFTTIQGNALDSANGKMTNAPVRLRDARFGRIVERQLTDGTGLFTFRTVDPGSYIVELLSSEDMVLAASQLLNVNGGEAVSAIVRMPFKMPPFAGLLGHSASQAAAVSSAALASGVLALDVTGQCVSPPCE